jgi:hypothetical protein
LRRDGVVGFMAGWHRWRYSRDGRLLSPLQNNVPNRRAWPTRAELLIAIATWIERTCHRRRRQPRLGQLRPIDSETIMSPAAAPAA